MEVSPWFKPVLWCYVGREGKSVVVMGRFCVNFLRSFLGARAQVVFDGWAHAVAVGRSSWGAGIGQLAVR